MLNLGPLFGMRAGMELLMEIGVDEVAARISSLVKRLAEGLGRLGFAIASPVEGPTASGMLTVHHPAADAGALFRFLKEHGVTVSQRKDRAGKTFLRLSPHFYNTEAEIDRALEVMRSALEPHSVNSH